jgi:hypothetical protein
MAGKALFTGLIVDEFENPVAVTQIGGEAFYVVDDEGFHRHISSEFIDRQVLEHFLEMIEGNEELIAEGTMKMIGQEDIFTKAMIETSLKNVDEQIHSILEQGLPEEAQTWLGMIGFGVVINVHGEVIDVIQPSVSDEPGD